MLQMKVQVIEPDEQTFYLVGSEGLVWVQPSIGEPHIIAARNDQERQTAALFVGELLKMRLVPYGIPLNQLAIVAMFGGSLTRDCQWIKWTDAPGPVGDGGDDLPEHAAVIL
jgi:hypothetical protein